MALRQRIAWLWRLFFGDSARAFGSVSVIFLVSLAIAPAKDHFSEWRHYQKQYLKLVAGRADALTLQRHLERGINPARWIEYSLSSALMIVVIAMLAGIYDIASLLLIFALNATMILFGWLMELHNQKTPRTNWTAYWFGCFAGAVPWIAVAVYLAGDAAPPGFVYGFFASIFVFFNVFAVNMLLQYRKVGRWRDYLYGERVYMLLSLFAKSALAWQVFAGTLQPA